MEGSNPFNRVSIKDSRCVSTDFTFPTIHAEIGKSSSPKEAIHRTSKYRKYPGSYEIVAYDLSTKTNAAIHEENIKKDTLDSRTFIEPQEFRGHTELVSLQLKKIEGGILEKN